MNAARRLDFELLAPYVPSEAQPFDRAAATAMLRRVTIAHPPEWIDRCLALGPTEAAKMLVRGEAPDASERAVLARRDMVLALEEPDATAAWIWSRLLSTTHPLRARMMLVWHDHFATSIRKVKSSLWMTQQIDVFAEHGLGRFGDLLRAVAKGPAMLRWLDAESNRKGSANENFARELFELFALGRGAYEEADIAEAARAFTGWRIAREAFHFDGRRHDRGEKVVFAERGSFDGDAVIELTLAQPACARFVARRLLEVFVGPEAPAQAIDELAALLRANELRIDAALEVLLASQLFHDPHHRATRVRGPIEWIVWILRTLELEAAPAALHAASGRMGQRLLDPPDVSGWAGEASWISSATWLERANFAARLGREAKPLYLRPSLEERVRPRRPVAELDWLAERLFPEGLKASTRTKLEQQVRGESRLPRALRLAGTLRALLLLPRAHRF